MVCGHSRIGETWDGIILDIAGIRSVDSIYKAIKAQRTIAASRALHVLARTSARRCFAPPTITRFTPACDGIKMWYSIPRVGIYVTLRSSHIITRQHTLLRTTQAHQIFCICLHSLTCIAKQVCTRSLLSGRVHTHWHPTGADDPDRRYWAYGV